MVADPPLVRGRPQSLAMQETAPRGRTTSDQNPAGHRGNDDGMSVHGDPTQHGKPQAVRARGPQPDAREGQAGLPGGGGEARSTCEAG